MKTFDLKSLYGPGIPVTVQYKFNLTVWHLLGLAAVAALAFYGASTGIKNTMALMAKKTK
jgi:hypothetical protein